MEGRGERGRGALILQQGTKEDVQIDNYPSEMMINAKMNPSELRLPAISTRGKFPTQNFDPKEKLCFLSAVLILRSCTVGNDNLVSNRLF